MQYLIDLLSFWLGPERVAYLLGVDLPANSSAHLGPLVLDYRGMIPWWLGAFIVVVLGVGIFLLHAFEKTVGWFRRILLFLIRTAVLGLVVWLLLRPVLLLEFNSERPRSIYFLLDNSQSMKQRDRRVTNTDRLRVAVAQGKVTLTSPDDLSDSAARIPANVADNPSRQQMVEWVLKDDKLNLVESLEKKGPLQPFLFGERFRSPHEESSAAAGSSAVKDTLLHSFTASADKTALADSIIGLLQRKDSELPAALVVVTDGQDNHSKYTFQEAAAECKRVNVPLHIYGVGSAAGGSLKLRNVITADSVFVDDNVQVPISYAAHAFKAGAFEFTLELGDAKHGYKTVKLNVDGKKLDKKIVKVRQPLPGGAEKINLGSDLRDTLEFTLDRKMVEDWVKTAEFVNFQVKVVYRGQDPKDSERYADKMVRQVRVVDRKIKILVIEGSPRFEWKFLQAALLRDRRIEPMFYLLSADQRITGGMPYNANEPKSKEDKPRQPYILKLPETKAKFFQANFDVILLGDVNPRDLLKSNKDALEWIREFVQEKRGGLIVMAGSQFMPRAYAGTPIEEMIPVEFDPHVQPPNPLENRPVEYAPTLTDDGRRTNMMFLDDSPEDNLKVWRSLPGFFWQFPVKKLRPGATQLVVNPRPKMVADVKPGTKAEMPLVATQYYGKGLVFFMGTDETWRWRFNVQDKYFVRFWGQVIYEMGLPHMLGEGAKRVQFALQGAEATLNNGGYLFVHMVNKDFDPRKDEKVEADLTYRDAKPEEHKKITLTQVPDRPGDYRAWLEHDKPGRWQVAVNNPGDAAPQTFEFRVEIPKMHELDEAGMAESALRDLASNSGGAFYREEDLFLNKLAQNVKPMMTSVQTHEEKVLWNNRFLILFVLLITCEWLVRKFANLC